MELLDDNIKLKSDGLSVLKLEEKIAVKQEYLKVNKDFIYARITTGIITFLSIITILFAASSNVEIVLPELGILLIYIVAIFVPLKYSKYSLSLISLLYAANLALAFTSYSNGLLFLIIVVRLVILYFIVRGAYSGFKVDAILNKMKSLDMKVLKD